MKHDIGFILIIIGLAIIGYLQFENRERQKEYWEDPNFRTDTVHVEVDYSKLPKPEFKYDVPPARVFYYNRDTTIVNNTYLSFDDSLITVIDSLTNRITKINEDYLKLYSDYSKLIYGEFTGDSLRLDLLNINGTMSSLRFGVNYDKFRYQWEEGSFRASPALSKPNVFDRIKLQIQAGAYITPKGLQPGVGLGLGYNLWQ